MQEPAESRSFGQSRYLQGDGARLFVESGGLDESVPIVFIHGFAQCSLSFDSIFNEPRLAHVGRVRYDLRGHGGSDAPSAPDNYRASSMWAADLKLVLDRTTRGPVMLLAWSYGGYVALDFIRHFGDAQVAGLVLVGGGVQFGVPSAEPLVSTRLLEATADMLGDAFERSLDGALRFVKAASAAPVAPDLELKMGAWTFAVPKYVKSAMVDRVCDNQDVLTRFRKPVLAIHGKADGLVLPAMSRTEASGIFPLAPPGGKRVSIAQMNR